MEDQSYNGSVWNKQAYALLQNFGWRRIGDYDMDVTGHDHKDVGIDTIVSFETPLKTKPQLAILESKRYLTTSFSQSNLIDWIKRLDTKINKLKNSAEFQEKFPIVTECTTLDTGIIALWFYDVMKFQEYYPTLQNYLSQITLTSRSTRKAGLSKIYFLANDRLMRLFALDEVLREITADGEKEVVFVYSPHFISWNCIQRSKVLNIESLFSDIIFAEIRDVNDKSNVETLIFYFGSKDLKSFEFVKRAFASTVQWEKSHPVVLYVYGADDDFRKIKPDVTGRIFEGFNLRICHMSENYQLPGKYQDID